jgi:hypothetical protein
MFARRRVEIVWIEVLSVTCVPDSETDAAQRSIVHLLLS